ncbi:riboflavin synthase [Erythrobacter litoralis]|uniref:Riboflavin synthase n=1 Tax=Erythrobacter litoralis (strain HTCC2594) TaxID=314225 RepID=Q2NDX0_ERYLH|nr:riboflavin synthase [Erythrobacter litoralis]ABC62121.1 riboflavin synthase alpha chain [Erythrobacter litoralis HTCC2594]
MFTGIVTAIGTIESAEQLSDLRVRVRCPYDPADIAIGASIACSGACMTVVDRGGREGDAWFAVDVSGESVSKTASDMWQVGGALNLETALKLGDELGGHIVTGHVDAVGTVESAVEVGGSHTVKIRAPKDLAPYIAPKGSITVDGVSLTVNEVTDHDDGSCTFSLNIIPHTWEVTTLGRIEAGSEVNLEIDVLARYLRRMESLRAA